MRISMIVACSAHGGAIGKNNQMLWHIPEDFKYFKRVTMGKPVIMGRKTYESIGRLLPGRQNIIVTRNEGFHVEGADIVNNLNDALTLAKAASPEEIFFIGGGQIYEQAFGLSDTIYLTEVYRQYDEADAFFSMPDRSIWKEVSRENHKGDGKEKPDYSFVVLERQ